MKICLICVELFGQGVYGGFGRATRKIGGELRKRNIEVDVVVPQREGSREREYLLDGMRVLEFPRNSIWTSLDLYRRTDADLFHSQDPSLGTWMAMRAMPKRAHMMTFRDPLESQDWRIEFRYSHAGRLAMLGYALYVDNFLAGRAVRRAHARYCAAKFLIPKSARKFRLRREPGFLPTPVDVPDTVSKAARPTVCFLGRLHPIKRPELFLELAKSFPEVQFICVGGSNDRDYEESLRRTYAGIPNLEMTGTIDQFQTDRLHRILEQSWILINTSAKEGLPNAFLEAAASRCAILCRMDPDGFASQFGYCAADGDLRKGLSYLLAENRWKEQGERGWQYVKSVFGNEAAMDAHMDAYRRLSRQ